MKRIFVLVAAGLIMGSVQAQDDAEEYAVVLPSAAQKCVLPASPDAIPEEANIEDLKKAKAGVATFQTAVTEFRACLEVADKDPDNTPGNKQAIVQSFNYSVEMEERVAARFNEAVRDYKARKAAAEG